MLLCCDCVALIKKKHKQLRIQRSLSAKRTYTERRNENGRFTMLDHNQGKQSSYYYERDTNKKVARVN